MLCMRERVHAQMMLVQSNVHRESTTAQVEGSAKILVTVVATQELKAGNLLRRFKAKAAPDEPRRGNDNDTLSVFENCFATHGIFSLY